MALAFLDSPGADRIFELTLGTTVGLLLVILAVFIFATVIALMLKLTVWLAKLLAYEVWALFGPGGEHEPRIDKEPKTRPWALHWEDEE